MSARPSRFEFSTVRLRFGEPAGGRLGRALGRPRPCVGRLYRPDRPRDPPVVVCAPGVGLTAADGIDQVAERLAARGVAALAFDYRGWGASAGAADVGGRDDGEGVDGALPAVSPTRQRSDLRAAVDTVRDLEDVDGSRLGLWGIDLGAAHALALAADLPAVDAVVARAPAVRGRGLQPPRLRPHLGGLAAGLVDRLLAPVGRSRAVPIFGPPDAAALVAAPGVEAAVRDLRGGGSTAPDRTPARSYLALRGDDVRNALPDVGCPALFVAGTGDRVVETDAVERASERVPDSSLLRLPVGHHESLHGRAAERVLGQELAFLESEL